MAHLFSVQTPLATLFIRSIDTERKRIVYDVRDKETGILLEPQKDSGYVIFEGNMRFDHIRFIPIPLLEQIMSTIQ